MPCWECSHAFHIAVLIELALLALMEVIGDVAKEQSIFSVHCGILAGSVLGVPRLEVMVSSSGFPSKIVFVPQEGSGGVHRILEADQVTHPAFRHQLHINYRRQTLNLRSHCIVQDDVHISAMNFGDKSPPVVDYAVVRIQERKIQRAVTVSSPRLIDERAPCEVNSLRKHQSTFIVKEGEVLHTFTPMPWI